MHNCYGDELGLTSDDEDYIDPYENRDDETAQPGQSKITDSVSEVGNGFGRFSMRNFLKNFFFLFQRIIRNHIRTALPRR